MEKQGETDDLAVFLGKDHLAGTFLKQGVAQSGFVGDHFVGAFFINGEFLDELKDKTGFLRLRGTDVEFVVHGCKGVS